MCVHVCSSLHCLQIMLGRSELVVHVRRRCQKLVGQHCQLVHRDLAALVPSRAMFSMCYSMNQMSQKVGVGCHHVTL